ncbi:BglG family transcription antiterminator [Enterococcus villorum]|uniref:Transcriptional regulator n=2 Tax=Enterococcus villorum TaxID=112904 RepID=A0A511J163_9ENTE|nr:PRD domain-containing protein [Enterococcus villorum]EOH91491.1 hypothetical protein UAO_00824 [Enterococcus villorum ATCC 700913]EOW76869.1 hypothetical protein I591_02177 [Enterococcus villorum ATCC 700913]GEL91748.1 transcriptional regulator [Enterococcus villorum]
MQLGKREKEMIEYFLKYGLTLTAQELAGFAHVSTKTVYRTIKKVNEVSGNGDIILAVAGKGFRLDYDKYLNESIRNDESRKHQGPLERRNAILINLLFKSPKKLLIHELFQPYYLSNSVINNDLTKINLFLANHHLKLIRQGARIGVEGAEKNIRKVVNMLLSINLLDDKKIVPSQSWIHSFDINFITTIVEFIEQKLVSRIAYPYAMNIFSHLYILVKRFREGVVYLEETFWELNEEDKQMIRCNQELYQLSKQTMLKMSQYLGISLPESESFYLFQYLISSRIENGEIKHQNGSDEAKEITCFFSTHMSRLMGLAIDQEENRQDLYRHIQPLLYRLKHEIMIKNDLLNDIELAYTETFKQVETVSKMVQETFHTNHISKSEIGFLTLYFVKYKELTPVKKRVVIMCSSGVGTSELLKVKVKKAFPELEIVAVLSARQYQKKRVEFGEIDLILTTVHLNEPTKVPMILVNSVFTKQDEKRVQQQLGEM